MACGRAYAVYRGFPGQSVIDSLTAVAAPEPWQEQQESRSKQQFSAGFGNGRTVRAFPFEFMVIKMERIVIPSLHFPVVLVWVEETGEAVLIVIQRPVVVDGSGLIFRVVFVEDGILVVGAIALPFMRENDIVVEENGSVERNLEDFLVEPSIVKATVLSLSPKLKA